MAKVIGIDLGTSNLLILSEAQGAKRLSEETKLSIRRSFSEGGLSK